MDSIVPSDTPQGNHAPKTVYIYTLSSPSAPEQVRYVGKTDDLSRRFTQHIRIEDDTYKGRWISLLQSQGLLPIMTIIEEATSENWEERETFWILYYLEHGHPLTNTFMGSRGPGIVPPETREKMSLAHRGKKQSPEHIAKRTAGAKGRKASPETRAKLSAFRKGQKSSPEAVAKSAATRTGRKASPEHRAKISATNKGRKMTPEQIARMIEAKRKNREARLREMPPPEPEVKERKRRSPEDIAEGVERMARANRGRKQSLEHIAKRTAVQKGRKHTAEQHEKIAAKNRGRKQSPEHIAKRIASIKARAIRKNPPDSPTLWD